MVVARPLEHGDELRLPGGRGLALAEGQAKQLALTGRARRTKLAGGAVRRCRVELRCRAAGRRPAVHLAAAEDDEEVVAVEGEAGAAAAV
eukprot:CAMPEP_0204188748 /NCGR_PEP_ID=MMETSP0361-20130328/57904_1 /ASSEMBLY_ACC=CAM_ASM_000343 /TAXON_ID=268821 /ORGANISM="Scrippsiella Hangoei, Strain SHTV-5" /LENGTH=89 /DNA_ID=CAMNT_0051149347 /DNA_START=190 /DNA_END=455 /DNA_ORIENTATION=+